MCPHCKGRVIVVLPTKPGINWSRQGEIRKAIDEHRRVCTVGDMTSGYVYDIQYPRA